jgi:probable F420-dependent oxidoreductase
VALIQEPDPMTRAIRIALQLQPQHAEYSEIRDAVVRGEEMGVDIIFNWDHFFPLSGDPSGLHFECWTMLASWAEVTERVEIGALVTANSYRNPELLADMARTVDHASEGRLILGIGAGWFEKDYDEYGYEFGTPGSRLADLRASLPRIERRLSRLNPPPRRDIPILIGGGGEKKTLRYTAEFADIWHGFGNPDVINHKNKVLDDHCSDIGRDPSEIERSTGASPTRVQVGDKLIEAGANLITLGFDGRTGYDLSPVKDWLAWRDERNAG